MPLKSKFFIVVIGSVLIPMLLVSVLLGYHIKNIMVDNAILSIQGTVNQASTSLDEMVRGQMYSVSGILSTDKELYDLLTKSYDMGRVQEYFDIANLNEKIESGYGRIHQEIMLSAIVGVNEVIYNLSLPTFENAEMIDRLRQIKEETRIQGTNILWYGLEDNIFTNRRTGNPREDRIVMAAMNIFMPKTGEYVGVQVYALPESILYEKYRNTEVAQNGTVMILNNNGELISSNIDGYVSGETMVNTENIAENLKGGKAEFTEKSNGKLLTVRRSDLTGWYSIVEIPKEYAIGEVDSVFIFFWLAIFASASACSIAFISLADKVIRPIKNVINSMKRFEMGDMQSYVKGDGESEVGFLEAYYNRMIDKINHHIVYEYEMDKRKRQLEYDILMSQINSHFLSNTLESIAWKARATESYDAAKMASLLGDFFRLSSSKKDMFATVAEEIEHIKAYVEIQKIRYGDQFEFVLEVEDDGKIKKNFTLKILLQPLVENAIMHATDGSDHCVTIRVCIYNKDGMMRLEVSDDGPGMSKESLERLSHKLEGSINRNRGIGLRNIKERINLYFAVDYPETDVIIESEQGKGTKVTLVLPILEKNIGGYLQEGYF
jgi:sensor histidine kinase YesM